MSQRSFTASKSAGAVPLGAKTGNKVVSKANYLAAPSAPDLLSDAAATKPGKPRMRARVKAPEGNGK